MIAVLNMAFMSENKNYIVFNSQQLVYLPELNFSLYPDVLVVWNLGIRSRAHRKIGVKNQFNPFPNPFIIIKH